MSFLEVKNVTVSYGGNLVLKQVSFNVEKGEIMAIVGPNGSGKSTLVRALLGLIPSTGEIHFDGRKMEKNTSLAGYVPQRFEFDTTFPLTVEEFLLLAHQSLQGVEQKELLKDLQVDSLLPKMLGSLSGGQLQRVLIVQALLANPRILILDEPTTGIDPEGRQHFYELIKHLNREHQMTIILISHETESVHALSNKVLYLDKQTYRFI